MNSIIFCLNSFFLQPCLTGYPIMEICCFLYYFEISGSQLFFVGEPLTKEEMEEREIRRRRRQKDKKTDFAKKLTHNFSVDFLLVGNFFLRKKN